MTTRREALTGEGGVARAAGRGAPSRAGTQGGEVVLVVTLAGRGGENAGELDV